MKTTVLPADYPSWPIRLSNGLSLAHEALSYGTLPYDFEQWDILDENGDTVAKSALEKGALPKNFMAWWLEDAEGHALGHKAAEAKLLPTNMLMWRYVDSCGDCIGVSAVRYQGIFSEQREYWAACGNDGWTIAQKVNAAFGGREVALGREMAKNDLLPEDFDGWGWTDRNGKTVAEVVLENGCDLDRFVFFPMELMNFDPRI